MFFGNEHEVYLYAQNGFEASVLLPAGVYYVRKAFVVGDSEGAVYRLVVSENRRRKNSRKERTWFNSRSRSLWERG